MSVEEYIEAEAAKAKAELEAQLEPLRRLAVRATAVQSLLPPSLTTTTTATTEISPRREASRRGQEGRQEAASAADRARDHQPRRGRLGAFGFGAGV